MFKSLTRSERLGLRAWGVVCLLLTLSTLAWAQAPVNTHGWWYMALPRGTNPDFTFQTKSATAGHKVLSIKDDSATEVWSVTREGVVTGSAGNTAYCTTQFNKTSTVTPASITGMSVTLLAGKKYAFRAKLFTISTANGGLKLGFGGTATATAFLAEVKAFTTTTPNISGQVTALNSTVGDTVATDSATVEGYIDTNAAGTFTLQMGQNASHMDTSSVKVGSYLILTPLS